MQHYNSGSDIKKYPSIKQNSNPYSDIEEFKKIE